MENKGLLKLPETWFVVVTESNKEVLEKWFKIKYPDYELYCKNVGIYKWKKGSKTIIGQSDDITDQSFDFGQQITFADFKRLVLGEKNHEDYGVLGCEELVNYLNDNDKISGMYDDKVYFKSGDNWSWGHQCHSNRQSLPITEYLKLIEPETMEKKYEYKLRDEKYIEPILKLTDRKIDFTFPLREEIVPNTITILRDLNVLDLFFEKIELKELPIIGGSKPIISEDGDLIEIAGFQIDMYIIDHFKSFTLGNDIHVSESDIKQIREYLRK